LALLEEPELISGVNLRFELEESGGPEEDQEFGKEELSEDVTKLVWVQLLKVSAYQRVFFN
jgi:hypothetical protein